MTEQDLLARLDRLESLAAIEKLKARYCAGCDDDHNADTLEALFVEDGIWECEGMANAQNHAERRQFFTDLAASKRIRNSAHMVMNPNIEIDGDTATGHWRFIMAYTGNVGDGTTQFHRIIGYYQDDFIRVDGTWYFKHLRPIVEESNSYDVIEDTIGTKF